MEWDIADVFTARVKAKMTLDCLRVNTPHYTDMIDGCATVDEVRKVFNEILDDEYATLMKCKDKLP